MKRKHKRKKGAEILFQVCVINAVGTDFRVLPVYAIISVSIVYRSTRKIQSQCW